LKLLIIEDDITLSRLLGGHLQSRGYEVMTATGGAEGLRLAREAMPDLVILDVMMPGMDGLEVCRHLRATSTVPILMLTAKGAQEDVIQGLELGADDYLKKPFDLRELELRIKAILRRSEEGPGDQANVYDDGSLRVDLERRLVLRQGQRVHLTPTEFRLLSYLLRHKGRVVPHEELLTEVWGPEYIQETANLSVYVRYLREKLESAPGDPRYIFTEWGIGYRFGYLSPGTPGR
jgi:two-component system, OmpR family, KDP operon response regulator KdpE